MSDYYWHDPEMPAGYQDADIEQAAYEAEGARIAQLRKQGICTHGWIQGYKEGRTPNLNPGECECLHCHVIGTYEDLGWEQYEA